ncbi:HAMP domain-containing protein [Leucothrix sargassi]|nr:HAMP domain-containing protein [Leucothrix sargassi]
MIRFSISQKLMCAFLGLTIIVLVATLGLARWSFDRGFLDYVNALEQVRLESIGEKVSQLYIQNDRDWAKVPESELRYNLSLPPDSNNGSRRRGPPPRKDGEARHPPPPHGAEGGPPPSGRPGRRPNFPPTALFDLDNTKIIGRVLSDQPVDTIDVPVTVDGETVGILRSEPLRQLSSSIETDFSRQQLFRSVVIGIASLILAVLVSWLLTRLFVSPVRQIISRVDKLSKGDYSQDQTKNYQDEFGLLAEDINHLANTLEKNRSARNRWLADISHELRTPLAILTGEIEAMKDGIREFGPQQLTSLDQETQRLRLLIDDLYQLSLSDIGGLRYTFTELDLAESIAQVINVNERSAADKNITITFTKKDGVLVSADSARISQLIVNILRNAIAYTNEGGRIEMMLKTYKGRAVFEVHDTPPGVKKEDCGRLFEPLYREDESRTRRGCGAGLGLAICQNIVEAHRGSISASPSPLGGVRITVELPLLKKGDSHE